MSGLMSGIWKRNGLTAPRQISTLPRWVNRQDFDELSRVAHCGLEALKQTLRVRLGAVLQLGFETGFETLLFKEQQNGPA